MPVTVKLADGTSYLIPDAGPWGSPTWRRFAFLVAVAYRQVGDTANADKWDREASRRNAIWAALGAGRDRAAVVAQFGADLLTAPAEILADVGNVALGAVRWLPWLIVAALAVVALGFQKKTLRIGV